MFQLAKPLFFRTETQLHAGSGSDLGHIDLPIQREKHTDIPNIQSSSLKGAFRQHLEQISNDDTNAIKIQLAFGFDKDGVIENSKVDTVFKNKETQDYAGSIAFTDARLLLFPIKSYKGIYALATCPRIISQFMKEVKFICNGVTLPEPTNNFNFADLASDRVAISDATFLVYPNGSSPNKKVILEEYAFEIESAKKNDATNFASYLTTLLGDTSGDISKHLVIIPDEIFRDFTRLSTEVVTRIKINNETGTVQSGALFTEEYLPAESYMYTIVAASNVFSSAKNGYLNTATDVINFFEEQVTAKSIMQIGGNSTLGKGIVKLFPNNLNQA
jgi:CRISPR-associated protein Cmr4